MLPKRYNPQETEPRLCETWQENGTYHYEAQTGAKVYSVDTPPATVSGNLHLGHAFSYSHPDFLARFWRMNGYQVFYPMGYDDNGLPTGRMVEKHLGVSAKQIGRSAFIEKCLEISQEAEAEYETLWKRLGLSIDWRYTYRTIDRHSRRTSQLSFIELYKMGLIYQREAPAIWCPECRTPIAQAEQNDKERQSEFFTLTFGLEETGSEGGSIPVATTRPELLPACVAVFVNADDERFSHLIDKMCTVPIFSQQVPIMADPDADPTKGTGAVMCCTFGDTMDVTWWYRHNLPLVEAIDRSAHMTQAAGEYAGLSIKEARQRIVQAAKTSGYLIDRHPTSQSIRVHERCDSPVEYVVAKQWFTRVMDHKDEFIRIGNSIEWHPEHMGARYRAWVENLSWDWCISRQRYYGVAFPLWYCQECGKVFLADIDQLPVDPLKQSPGRPCSCGSKSFIPEEDVMDTWATSSLSPQIVGRWLPDSGNSPAADPEEGLYQQVFPFSVRPQAHEIIRTWAFYTIVKSHYHFGKIPWKEVLISGWGIAGEGMGKISKSRGGGPMAPIEMIERYSADAVRYWAASTGPGKDAIISEEKIKLGAKLITKLWNVARFCARFLGDYQAGEHLGEHLTPADRWILSRTQQLIIRATELYQNYDYAAAKSEIESFFWRELADNYLEMCKQRLYDEANPARWGALFTLHHVLLTVLKLFAPLLPFVTETIYQGIYAGEPGERSNGSASIHKSRWPEADQHLLDERAAALGETLLVIATAVRRYKSEHNLPLGTRIAWLGLSLENEALAEELTLARDDLSSITRAQEIEIVEGFDALSGLLLDGVEGDIQVAIRD